MKKEKNKKMTLDKLALMIGKGFNGTDKKFAQVNAKIDEKFEKVDKKIDQVVKEINKINLNTVDVVRQRDFADLKDRVVDLEEIADLRVKKS